MTKSIEGCLAYANPLPGRSEVQEIVNKLVAAVQDAQWVSVKDSLPRCHHEDTFSGSDISDTVFIFGKCVDDLPGQGVGDYSDGRT